MSSVFPGFTIIALQTGPAALRQFVTLGRSASHNKLNKLS